MRRAARMAHDPNHPRRTRRAGAHPEPETHNKSRVARNVRDRTGRIPNIGLNT